jgi:predicted membrane protein
MESSTVRLTPKLVVGLFIIMLGVVFTLDNLGLVEGDRILRFWPVGLILLGAAVLANARAEPGYVAGGFWLVLGIGLLLNELDLLDVDFGALWPLVLVAAGGYLVWQAMTGRTRQPRAEERAAERLNAVAVMGGVARSSGVSDFRGGELTAIMGGCEIDLRKASIASGPATIDTFALWGGIEIKVPPDWTVEGKVFPIMGAFEDKTRPPDDVSKRLVIRGLVLMGGIEVKN